MRAQSQTFVLSCSHSSLLCINCQQKCHKLEVPFDAACEPRTRVTGLN